MEKWSRRGGVIVFFVGLVGLVASAAPPTLTELNPSLGCGYTIADPGEYVLTGDFVCSGPVNGLVIAASDVVLHLAGHTISNTTCDQNYDIIGIYATGEHSGITIEGGTVSGFNDGVSVSASDSTVTGMTVTGSCYDGIIVQADNNTIEKNVVTGSGNGVTLAPAHGTLVRSNDLSGNAVGVLVSDSDGDAIPDANTIENNVINQNTQTGIYLYNGTGNTVQNNAVHYNHAGIQVLSPGHTIQNNRVSGSGGTGISVGLAGDPSTVQGNTVLGSGESDLTDDNATLGGNTWQNNTCQTGNACL